MSSTAQRIRFACTGCGKCCTGHHVPLTLAETRRWAQDGGQVIVLIGSGQRWAAKLSALTASRHSADLIQAL